MEILNYEEQPQGSFELALFDIDFGPKWGMILRRWKLCKSKKGHHYIQPSSYKGKGVDAYGKPNWMKYVDFYGDKGKEFNEQLMTLLSPYMKQERHDEVTF